MGMLIDAVDADPAAGTCALLERFGDGGMLSLGALSGAELCALGGAEHPVCWGPLTDAWQQLDPAGQQRVADVSTAGLLRRGLIRQRPAGRGVQALFVRACYQVSAELGILLGARESPALVIATHHESRSPDVTYFQRPGTGPVVFVEEIPERAGDGASGAGRGPLEVIFSYRLLTPARTASELARWAVKPVRAGRYQPRPPRLIGFFGDGEGGSPSYQLAVRGDGHEAYAQGPGLCADLSRQELTDLMTDLMTDLVTEWTHTRS
jgi:hypothetical protein